MPIAPKWSKLQTSELTCMFSETVWTWPPNFFPKRGCRLSWSISSIFQQKFTLKCASRPKIAKKSLKTHISGVQGRSGSSILVPPESSSGVNPYTVEIYVQCRTFRVQVVLVYLEWFRCNWLVKCVLQLKIAKNLLKTPILGVQGRSRSSMLVPQESSSVPVMISS